MNKKVLILTSIAAIFILCSWVSLVEKEIKNVEWLIGIWENKTDRGSVYESWTKLNENELSGKSYVLKGKDTIVFETMRIIKEDNNLFYIPTVQGQNNDLPVRFSLKKITETELVFENPEHDFPQIISYTKTGKKSLVAEILGNVNGKDVKESFSMKKLK